MRVFDRAIPNLTVLDAGALNHPELPVLLEKGGIQLVDD